MLSKQSRPGCGRIVVKCVDGQSAAVSVEAHSPLRLLVPEPRGEIVISYTSTYGGGLVAGDAIDLTVEVGEGARCFLGSQSNTKVYRTESSLDCSQQLTAIVGADAFLVMIPDPVQPFAESVYRQRQQFHLDAAADLIFLDAVSSGRPARGERWAMRSFETRNEILIDGKPIAVDAMLLDSQSGPLEESTRVGAYDCFGTLWMLGPESQKIASQLLAVLNAQPVERAATTLFSASLLPQGAVVRIASDRPQNLLRFVVECLEHLPMLSRARPWARKW